MVVLAMSAAVTSLTSGGSNTDSISQRLQLARTFTSLSHHSFAAQADRQSDKQACRWVNAQTYRQLDRQADGQSSGCILLTGNCMQHIRVEEKKTDNKTTRRRTCPGGVGISHLPWRDASSPRLCWRQHESPAHGPHHLSPDMCADQLMRE